MSETQLAKFSLDSFSVKESHIIINDVEGGGDITVAFEPAGYIRKALHQFQLDLKVAVDEDNGRFSIKLHTTSLFDFPAETDTEIYKATYFTINAPALVFPYIRAFISNITAQSGILTITLPTYNLTHVGEELKENIHTAD